MADKILNTRIALKIGTLSEWQAGKYNKTEYLKKGELAIVTIGTDVETNHPVDNTKTHPILFKVGTGAHYFDDLPWASALAADVYDWAKAATKPSYTASEIDGLEEFIAGEIQDTDTTYTFEIANNDLLIKVFNKAGEQTDSKTLPIVSDAELVEILKGYQKAGSYKTTQTAVEDQITKAAHVLDSLTQNANGEISYTVKELTPGDIGAQPAGNYKTIQKAVSETGAANQTLKISQDTNGVITATPENIAITASQVTDFATEVAEIKVKSATNADNATTAAKVGNALTVGNKTFDGSAAVEVTAADLGLESAMHFIGALSAAPENPKAGDVYLNTATKKEYVYDTTNGWVELGDEGSYALRNVKIIANEGLEGGGDLTADRTIGIAANGVTTAKIADANVTKAKLATDVQATLDKVGVLDPENTFIDANDTIAKVAGDAYALAKQSGNEIVTLSTDKMNKITMSSDEQAGEILVVTSTGHADVSGKKVTDFATAEQGTKADSALQPAALNDYSTTEAMKTYISEQAFAYASAVEAGLSLKVDRSSAVNDNIAIFDNNGGKIKDSGTNVAGVIAEAVSQANKYFDDNFHDNNTEYSAAADGGLKLDGTAFSIDDSLTWIFDCGGAND